MSALQKELEIKDIEIFNQYFQ